MATDAPQTPLELGAKLKGTLILILVLSLICVLTVNERNALSDAYSEVQRLDMAVDLLDTEVPRYYGVRAFDVMGQEIFANDLYSESIAQTALDLLTFDPRAEHVLVEDLRDRPSTYQIAFSEIAEHPWKHPLPNSLLFTIHEVPGRPAEAIVAIKSRPIVVGYFREGAISGGLHIDGKYYATPKTIRQNIVSIGRDFGVTGLTSSEAVRALEQRYVDQTVSVALLQTAVPAWLAVLLVAVVLISASISITHHLRRYLNSIQAPQLTRDQSSFVFSELNKTASDAIATTLAAAAAVPPIVLGWAYQSWTDTPFGDWIGTFAFASLPATILAYTLSKELRSLLLREDPRNNVGQITLDVVMFAAAIGWLVFSFTATPMWNDLTSLIKLQSHYFSIETARGPVIILMLLLSVCWWLHTLFRIYRLTNVAHQDTRVKDMLLCRMSIVMLGLASTPFQLDSSFHFSILCFGLSIVAGVHSSEYPFDSLFDILSFVALATTIVYISPFLDQFILQVVLLLHTICFLVMCLYLSSSKHSP